MQKRRITNISPQSIFDVLLQYAGGISGLFEFMNENNLKDLDINEGGYFEPDVINPEVVKYLNPQNKTTPTLASGVISDSSVYITDETGAYVVDDEDSYIIE